MAENDVDNELLDYEDDEVENAGSGDAVDLPAKKDVKGSYVSIHSSGFRDFLLKPELLRAIVDCGFEHPSEVQHECIPQAILGMDVLCQAKSGMGKTAVFVLATLQQLEPVTGQVSVLVMCHTRELAFQISKEYERFSKYMPTVKVAVFFGGLSIKKDEEVLKKNCPHVVVGTPGRILALARNKSLNLKHIKHFILDECDKMLEQLDMRRDVQEIFRMTPHEKQVMMFSATLSKEIRPVLARYQQFKDFQRRILVATNLFGRGMDIERVNIAFNYDMPEDSDTYLHRVARAGRFGTKGLAITFVSDENDAKVLNDVQDRFEVNISELPDEIDISSYSELARYQQFKDFQRRILVATNLFGRGMDIERVNIAFNYDMPEDSDTYLHRVARAGRFGTKGLAITFVSDENDAKVLNDVQDRFEVNISELPDEIDISSYSEYLLPLPHVIAIQFSTSIINHVLPMEIFVDDETKLTLHGLQQYYVKLKDNEKNRKLFDLLDVLEFNQVVIFVKSVQRCVALAQLLVEQNFPAIAIHRGMPQEERLARYQQFKDFQRRILVATNLFGRGMDIERVNIAFNYDMPEDSDTYLHRVARAGRFGTKGLAITFVSDENDAKVLNDVQDRFEVNISELPDEIDISSYSEYLLPLPHVIAIQFSTSIINHVLVGLAPNCTKRTSLIIGDTDT
ncbi:UNVERIFIED_CONTAM: hypothetical protein FKN15_026935 [Acipenser sinensis]